MSAPVVASGVTMGPLALMNAADRLSGAERWMTAAELQEVFKNLPSREQMREAVPADRRDAWDAIENGASSSENGADVSEKGPVRGGLPRGEVGGRPKPANAPETALPRARGVQR